MIAKAERAEYRREYDQHHEDNVARLQPLPQDPPNAQDLDQTSQAQEVSHIIDEYGLDADVEIFDGSQDIDDPDDDDEDDEGSDGPNANGNTRLHKVTSKRSRRGIHRMGFPITSAYKDILGELERAQESENETAEVLLKWFAICHGIDDFPPGEEPYPGRYEYRFCYRNLLTNVHHAYEHVHGCAKAYEREIQ